MAKKGLICVECKLRPITRYFNDMLCNRCYNRKWQTKAAALDDGVEEQKRYWQFEIRIDKKGQRRRRCWRPACGRWFVIKCKGQRYCTNTCKRFHNQTVEIGWIERKCNQP